MGLASFNRARRLQDEKVKQSGEGKTKQGNKKGQKTKKK